MTLLLEIATILAFMTFMAVVFWSYSKKRVNDFDDAANLPFALPDEANQASSRKVGASNE